MVTQPLFCPSCIFSKAQQLLAFLSFFLSFFLDCAVKGAHTWILCRAVEASATFWGTSKHLAVLILALTSHCWKSLSAARNLCSSRRSLFWHSRDALRLRLVGRGGKETDGDGWRGIRRALCHTLTPGIKYIHWQNRTETFTLMCIHCHWLIPVRTMTLTECNCNNLLPFLLLSFTLLHYCCIFCKCLFVC